MKRTSSNPTGIILIVLALQILPVSDTIAKYLSLVVPLILVIWARFLFHCLVAGAYTAYRYGWRYLLPALSWVQTARSAALFGAVAPFYVTIHHVPLTMALALWFVEPFILMILAQAYFRERVNSLQWLSVATGFLGVCVAIRPVIAGWHWAYLTGLLAGISYALFLLLTRAIDKETPPIVSVYQTGLVGCIVATVGVIPAWTTPTAAQWLFLIAIGVIAALAHFIIIKSFEIADAITLAPFTYSEIIAATILGYAVFGDIPDMWTMLGLLIIITSALMLLFCRSNQSPVAAL